jgi:NDP-sugar pyrophosphorylase family protein
VTPDATTPGAAGLRAVILAGGRGTRLQPFTINFPKPLMPLGDTPILEVLMERLVRFGVVDITLALGHLAELIRAYFDQRSSWKAKARINFVTEESPLGTAGALRLVDGLTETFLVMNGDLLTDLNFDELVRFHRRQNAALTVASHVREVQVDLGVLDVDENQFIRNYREKPVTNYTVSMGIYVFEPRVLSWIPPGRHLDFPDLVLKLLAAGERVASFPARCQWLDIGRPDDYRRAQELHGTSSGGTTQV